LKITWETLNGYVDGELGARAAAEVAALIARDPAMAARVATLHRLKAASASAVSRHPAPDSPAALRKRPGLRHRSWGFGAVAAAMATLIVALAGLWRVQHPAEERMASVAPAFAAYRDWLGQPASPELASPAAGQAPDLSAAGLRLVFARGEWDEPGQDGVFFGYVGPHGCKLGLWAGPLAAPLPAEPARLPPREAIEGFAWAFRDRAYVVAAKGMDRRRLQNLALAVAGLVKREQAPDDEDKIAVRAAAGPGAPCQA